MKRKILLTLLLFCCVVANAQISFVSNTSFGRLYDVTYDATVQNKLYARTLTSHIVVSLNQGTDWQLLYSHPSPIGNMKLISNNTALAFTSSEGIYTYSLTTNAITKLYAIPDINEPGVEDHWIVDYDIYGTDGNHLLVNVSYKVDFATFGKTFHTANAGETWNEIYHTIDYENVFILKVAFAPNNPQKIYLTRGNGNLDTIGGLFISENSGATWVEKLPGIVIEPIAFRPGVPNEIMIGTGVSFGYSPENIYKSLDGGDTWTAQNITWTDVTLNNINKIVYHPTDGNKIIVLEENEIVSTEDGGVTWNNEVFEPKDVNYNFGLNASYDPFNPEKIIITGNYTVQVTIDNGTTLTQLKAPFSTANNVSVAQTPQAAHIYYALQGGYVHKNLQTGANNSYDIKSLSIGSPIISYVTADPVVDGRIFIFNSGGLFGSSLLVSTDFGVTSTLISNPYSQQIQKIAVDPANTNILYMSLVSGESSNLYKIDLSNLEEILFEEVLTPEEGIVTGILIDPSNSSKITITKGSKLFVTTDAGVNWSAIETTGLTLATTDIIWDMAKSPLNNNLVIATSVGIFTSIDGDITWNEALLGVEARKVSYSPTNAGIIAAALYLTGTTTPALVFSGNSGETWKTVSTEDLKYIFTTSADFVFGANSVTAYIATSDLGVMSYVVDYDVLGTDNPQLPKNNIAIYPNPASSVLNITASDNSEIKNTVIYTLAGQKVIETAATSINVSTLSNGIYIVKSSTSNGGSYTQKLIKQ